ncbi:MAG: SDR family oxidoreductase [Bacteroidia bacterium]
MKVLVTGHRGYIGPHLVKLLQEAGHEVTGVDIDLFDGCAWEEMPKADHELLMDFRDLSIDQISKHDCVMHLAAISNDPMGSLVEDLTYSVNREGSIELARKAKEAGVPRFLFSGSCSVYGKGASLDLDENAELNPITAYAHSKIATEKAVREMADESFCPSYLRNSTAYGYSPNLRIDLVVNNLLGCAFAKGDIRIMSDGSPWRPLVHCADIARAFVAFLEAPREKVYNKAVNIGGNEENYQVKDVADYVQALMPNASIVYTGEVGEDPRNYRVNFDKLAEVLPDFQLAYTLESGMKELFDKYTEHNFNEEDFDGDQFVRLRTLKNRLSKLA